MFLSSYQHEYAHGLYTLPILDMGSQAVGKVMKQVGAEEWATRAGQRGMYHNLVIFIQSLSTGSYFMFPNLVQHGWGSGDPISQTPPIANVNT